MNAWRIKTMKDHTFKKSNVTIIIIIMKHMTHIIQWRLLRNSQLECRVLSAGGPIRCRHVGTPVQLNTGHMKYKFPTHTNRYCLLRLNCNIWYHRKFTLYIFSWLVREFFWLLRQRAVFSLTSMYVCMYVCLHKTKENEIQIFKKQWTLSRH